MNDKEENCLPLGFILCGIPNIQKFSMNHKLSILVSSGILSSSSSDSSDDEQWLGIIFFNDYVHSKPKIKDFIEKVVHKFTDDEIAGIPNILGAIDGSYISIRKPKHKIRSTYINRHHDCSITLQAICDAKKKFFDVFTGTPGKMHDARILQMSFIYKDQYLYQVCGSKYHILADSA
ncbi:hypothetical protein ACI65C_006776 [Semiaphis heraclei]